MTYPARRRGCGRVKNTVLVCASLLRSAPIRVTVPCTSGVVRWLNAGKRKVAFWPTCTWSMSQVAMRTSTLSTSWLGTIDITVSPGPITPPTVCTLKSCTTPDLRRAQLDALQLVLGGDAPLEQFADARLDLAQLLGRFGLHGLIDVDDLQLHLADLALRARDLRHQRAPFALQLGQVALRRQRAGDRHQLLLAHALEPLELLDHQLDFLVLGVALRGETLDLLPELADPLGELGDLALLGRQAELRTGASRPPRSSAASSLISAKIGREADGRRPGRARLPAAPCAPSAAPAARRRCRGWRAPASRRG